MIFFGECKKIAALSDDGVLVLSWRGLVPNALMVRSGDDCVSVFWLQYPDDQQVMMCLRWRLYGMTSMCLCFKWTMCLCWRLYWRLYWIVFHKWWWFREVNIRHHNYLHDTIITYVLLMCREVNINHHDLHDTIITYTTPWLLTRHRNYWCYMITDVSWSELSVELDNGWFKCLFWRIYWYALNSCDDDVVVVKLW